MITQILFAFISPLVLKQMECEWLKYFFTFIKVTMVPISFKLLIGHNTHGSEGNGVCFMLFTANINSGVNFNIITDAHDRISSISSHITSSLLPLLLHHSLPTSVAMHFVYCVYKLPLTETQTCGNPVVSSHLHTA